MRRALYGLGLMAALVTSWLATMPAAPHGAAPPVQPQALTPFGAAPELDRVLLQAVRTGLIPGAVLLVGHGDEVVYRRAYGSRSLIPVNEPMRPDTIFDAASLTKVIATTASLMKLFERGSVRIDDPVVNYLPRFADGKSSITVRDLMTHFSGLRPDLDLKPRWSGYETGIERALRETAMYPPGTHFQYSDINFVLLGEIVRTLAGKSLAEFAAEEIFRPLGMNETGFLPAAALRPRIAPTEIDEQTGQPLWGVVHDETARDMGGVAGHAGLFTTADDLARFARMMLHEGEITDPVAATRRRLFQAATVRKFTAPASPANQPILRGLGWDIDSPFSANRGELYPLGSYGHTGFTGTSLWIDPSSRSYVILLTNSVHPKRGKSLSSLRGRVATLVAANLGIPTPAVTLPAYEETIIGAGLHPAVARNASVKNGLDVMEESGFSELKGKRIGLITNHTGLDVNGRRNVDAMLAQGVRVLRLFSPEHGLAGREDRAVGDSVDAPTGLPVISLFQPNKRRLAAENMTGLDAVVFDIQDVGARFYTYSCTLLYALEEAATIHKPFYVLDRPNPITGTHVEGPLLDADLNSFVGCYDIPVRHGLTLGELATLANRERGWGADLHVIPVRGWQRGDWFDGLSLTWTDPSPNLRSLNAALLYPGLALLEMSTDLSVGRGTDAPFEQLGAEWIHGRELATELNRQWLPGVRVYATRFTPGSSKLAGHALEGVRFVITDREAFNSTLCGLAVAAALLKLYPGRLELAQNLRLIGSRVVTDKLQHGGDPRQITQGLEAGLRAYAERRKAALLY